MAGCCYCGSVEPEEQMHECEGNCGRFICEDCMGESKLIPFDGESDNIYNFCGNGDCEQHIEDYENDKYC